jgi:hypothetical protein
MPLHPFDLLHTLSLLLLLLLLLPLHRIFSMASPVAFRLQITRRNLRPCTSRPWKITLDNATTSIARKKRAQTMTRGIGGSGVVYVTRLHCQLQRTTLYFLPVSLPMPLLMSDPAATLRAGTMRGARKANLASGAWGKGSNAQRWPRIQWMCQKKQRGNSRVETVTCLGSERELGGGFHV